jgi:hypothetical protein
MVENGVPHCDVFTHGEQGPGVCPERAHTRAVFRGGPGGPPFWLVLTLCGTHLLRMRADPVFGPQLVAMGPIDGSLSPMPEPIPTKPTGVTVNGEPR